MKEEINLLPPVVRQARNKRLYQRRFKRLYWLTLVACFLVLGAYGAIYFVLQKTAIAVDEQLKIGEQSQADLIQEVEETNQLLRAVHTRYTAQKSWSPFIVNVLNRMPLDMTVTEIQLRNDPVAVVLTGRSASRASIVEFQRTLEQMPEVETVEAPLQNFASGPTVQFTFTVIREGSKKN